MKNFIRCLYSGLLAFPLVGADTPGAVQTPSSFNSTTIATNTSRYFLQRVTGFSQANEAYVFSLYNAGTRIARISALGCVTHFAGTNYFRLSCYKNGIITETNYMPINNSTLQISTNGYFSNGFDEVYTLQAVGVSGLIRGFEYIPKELYSVIIAPGETLTVTLDIKSSTQYTALIMWEEIVN